MSRVDGLGCLEINSERENGSFVIFVLFLKLLILLNFTKIGNL